MTEEYSDLFDFDAIPKSMYLEPGDYLMKGVSLSNELSSTGKLMLSSQAEVVEPKELAGRMLFENYVLGTNEKPKQVNVGAVGATNYRKMAEAAQLDKEARGSLSKACMAYPGVLYGVSVTTYTETQDNQYKGEVRNKITGYWKLGERQPMLKAGAPTYVAPSQPVAPPPQPGPAAAPPIPPVTTGPAVPPPPQAAALDPALSGAGVPTFTCTGCQQKVPLNQWEEHFKVCPARQQA